MNRFVNTADTAISDLNQDLALFVGLYANKNSTVDERDDVAHRILDGIRRVRDHVRDTILDTFVDAITKNKDVRWGVLEKFLWRVRDTELREKMFLAYVEMGLAKVSLDSESRRDAASLMHAIMNFIEDHAPKVPAKTTKALAKCVGDFIIGMPAGEGGVQMAVLTHLGSLYAEYMDDTEYYRNFAERFCATRSLYLAERSACENIRFCDATASFTLRLMVEVNAGVAKPYIRDLCAQVFRRGALPDFVKKDLGLRDEFRQSRLSRPPIWETVLMEASKDRSVATA